MSEVTENQETVEHSSPSSTAPRPAVPGLVLIHSAGKPMYGVLPLPREDGERALEIGRGLVGSLTLEDAALSRRHARVVAATGGGWRV